MVWKYEKFKGDLGIYAFCPECGFHHCPSRFDSKTMESDIAYQYNYCPICGEYLYNSNPEVDVVWNERNIIELWETERGGL